MNGNINVYINRQVIFFHEKEVMFKHMYGLNMKQFLIYNRNIIIVGVPEVMDSTSDRFNPDYEKNNVFAFNEHGELLWQKGKRLEYWKPKNKTIELPVEVIKIDGGMIKFYYQSDYEVWHNLETGEKIKEEYVFKK